MKDFKILMVRFINTTAGTDYLKCQFKTLQWLHNGRNSVSNYQPHNCLLNCLFRCRPKKKSKLRVTGLCAGNSPVTGELPAQMASNAENVSIWWHHHVYRYCLTSTEIIKMGCSHDHIMFIMGIPILVKQCLQDVNLFFVIIWLRFKARQFILRSEDSTISLGAKGRLELHAINPKTFVWLGIMGDLVKWESKMLFTRGQFWPPGIVVACVCPSVRPSPSLSVR